jgi:glyoxylase-like metal-dependent hydrolase (beta-lactamase superfamily II)
VSLCHDAVVDRVADGVYRLGSRWVNWYLVEHDGRLTLVDTGYPRYYEQLTAGLASLGRGAAEIDAVVLTHAHADHLGSAARLHEESGARVLAHPADADVVRAGSPEPPPGFFADAWRPRFVRYLLHALASGGRSIAPVPSVETFGEGEVVDVPGRPRVLHTPGHTPGHCAFLLEERGVLFSGDALVTLDTASGRTGPQSIRWNEDAEQATASYEQLRALPVSVVLPGHGEPWQPR